MDGSVVEEGAAVIASRVIHMEEQHPKMQRKLNRLHDFWWDKIILTMIILLLGVTSAQTIASYLQRTTVKCAIDDFSESIQAYIDELCSQEIPNYGRYFQIAIYAEVSLLSGLQIFWILICNGNHESFKSAVSSMDLKRNPNTGQFEASDLETVRYLERKLGSPVLFSIYILFKLILQFLFCMCGISISFIGELQFHDSIVFTCTNQSFDVGMQWPLSRPEIYCSYSELSYLQYLRWFNIAILVAIMIAIICGVIYLYFNKYWLDYKRVARFMRHTGLRREHYVTAKKQCFCCYPYLYTRQQTKHISHDLMFQLMRLYGTNYRTAGAVFSILIENHLEYITEENSNPLKLADKKHQLATYISDVVKSCKVQGGSGSNENQHLRPHAVLITHENDSQAYLFETNTFKNMICFNFNPHITNQTATVCERQRLRSIAPRIFQIPAHLWLWNRTKTDVRDKAEKQIEEAVDGMCRQEPQLPVVFIFAPISEEFYSNYHTECRVKNFLRCARRATEGRITFSVVIHPMSIGNNDVSSRFCGNVHQIPWWICSGEENNRRYWVKKKPVECKGVQYQLEIYTDSTDIAFNNDDLERKPMDPSQLHKLYVGQRECFQSDGDSRRLVQSIR